MSKVKSFSVNNGDLFYINHFSDNFTIIDCNLEDSLENRSEIIKEITNLKKKKGVSRFISTHPDEDHISGRGSVRKTRFSNVKKIKKLIEPNKINILYRSAPENAE